MPGSLSTLKKFPLSGIKIDQSFVRDIGNHRADLAIVDSILNLSGRLGLNVIAEGIEDAATQRMLASMGCNEGQGFHIGRPVPAAEFEKAHLRKAAAA